MARIDTKRTKKRMFNSRKFVQLVTKKQVKLVLAWAELRKEELLADWELAINGELPFKIEPLR